MFRTVSAVRQSQLRIDDEEPGVHAADVVTVRSESALKPGTIRSILALSEFSRRRDGVAALNEHTLLHVRHDPTAARADPGTEFGDVHLLATAGDTPDAPGALLGYAHVDPTDRVAGAVAEIVVHPDYRRRGIGQQLLAAALHQSPDGRLRLWAHGDHPGARALAARLGFSEVRRLDRMRRDLTEPLPTPTWPDGVRLRPFKPGTDDAAWLALNARAFADHPEQGRWTQADLTARMGEPWFDPNGFLLAEHTTPRGTPELVAFHWTKVHGHHHADGQVHDPIGEVYVVGVDPAWQGHGLGASITIAGLAWLAQQGLEQALLYVDADNSAALALYRRLGFHLWDTDVMFMHRPGDSSIKRD